MKNFISHGNTLDWTNGTGADVASGDGVMAGSLFGIAAGDIADGEQGVLNVNGVYELPKTASQAWTVGQKVYWTPGGAATTVASGNTLIGVAAAAVGGGASEVLGQVRLNGVSA